MITAAAKAISLPVIGDGRDLLTHSRVQTGKTCNRKQFFAYELGIRKKRKAQPLRMGQAIHHGIDVWNSGADPDTAIHEASIDYDELPNWTNTDELREEWMTEREIVRRMLAGYFWRWGEDGLEIISSEETFVVPIINPETGKPTPTFKFAGKWDGIVRLPDTRKAVKETKTVGMDISPGSDYWGRLHMDQQISGYMLAARTMGHDVQTVLYDCVRKPGIRPKNIAKGDRTAMTLSGLYYGERFDFSDGVPERETPAMYGARLNNDISERPDFYFARMEIPRLDSDIEDFQKELWDEQRQIRERQLNNRWSRNTAVCLLMGKCAYWDLCTTRWTPDQQLPGAFQIIEMVHPELSGDDDATDSD